MNWDALAAIAESVGAIGVIATLLYLAAQIRANTRSVHAATYQDTDRGVRELNLAVVQDSELCRIWTNGVLDFDSLPLEERIRFSYIAMLYLRVFQNADYQFAQGTLDQDMQATWRNQLRIICSTPGFGTWWERNESTLFLPAFEQLVSQLIVDNKKPERSGT